MDYKKGLIHLLSTIIFSIGFYLYFKNTSNLLNQTLISIAFITIGFSVLLSNIKSF